MRTAVEEDSDVAVAAPDGDQLLSRDGLSNKCAGRRDLALVRDEDPLRPEDPVQLLRVDVRIPVQRGRDPVAFNKGSPASVGSIRS